MIFERLYSEGLAQASYMIGCSGQALVVDPARDVERYMDAAAAHKLTIAHVVETHIHADFVSGSRELSRRTGARLYLSGEGGPEWTYGFAQEGKVLHNGDVIEVGNLRLKALHTPGHTPEHLSFLLTDLSRGDHPMGCFTGDFLFIGDAGRPDLLEKAAGIKDTAAAGARTLFQALQAFKAYPDHLLIWPGHGAGSACGKGLSAVPQSTLGYEKLTNWALTETDPDAFVQAVLEGQPDPPLYFAQMKRINKLGPDLERPRGLPRLGVNHLEGAFQKGLQVVDIRAAREFAHRHLQGALNIPFDGGFATWAGCLIPYDQDFYLIAPDRAQVALAQRALRAVGLDRCAGWVAAADLLAGPLPMAGHELLSPQALRQRLASDRITLLDVRTAAEHARGHIPGCLHVPLQRLSEHLAEVPRTPGVVVYCQGGARSAIAAGFLESQGYPEVMELEGGYQAFSRLESAELVAR